MSGLMPASRGPLPLILVSHSYRIRKVVGTTLPFIAPVADHGDSDSKLGLAGHKLTVVRPYLAPIMRLSCWPLRVPRFPKEITSFALTYGLIMTLKRIYDSYTILSLEQDMAHASFGPKVHKIMTQNIQKEPNRLKPSYRIILLGPRVGYGVCICTPCCYISVFLHGIWPETLLWSFDP